MVSYYGAPFQGWQIQAHGKTIQGEIEKALYKLYQSKIRIYGAGRTDSGVHAKTQAFHFDLEKNKIPTENLKSALNANTSQYISIYHIELCDDSFHARYSEHTKTYCYYFDLSKPADPLYLDRSFALNHRELNFEHMKEYCKLLCGTHDFKNFCSIQNSTETTVRTIVDTNLSNLSQDKKFHISIKGKGFLQHMVRIIAGTLIDIGLEKIELEFIKKCLTGFGSREELGKTLPAHGLFLERIFYHEDQFGYNEDRKCHKIEL